MSYGGEEREGGREGGAVKIQEELRSSKIAGISKKIREGSVDGNIVIRVLYFSIRVSTTGGIKYSIHCKQIR